MMATLLLKLSVSAIGTMEMFESGDTNAKNCTPLRKGEVSYKKNFEM